MGAPTKAANGIATSILATSGLSTLASRGVVWNDLVRSAWAPLALEAILIGQPHIVRHDAHASVKAGFTRDEIVDALNVALVVGGSIVIPHARHAMLSVDELFAEKASGTLPA